MKFEKARRIKELPPYLFAEIDRRKRDALAKGVDLIDLGIGDPDIPTPAPIVERLKIAAGTAVNHRYPSSSGLLEFREAVASWYETRFGVKLDPEREVVSLIGSKEGIANMAVAFVEPGELVLSTDPGYPVYQIGTSFSGGRSYSLPLVRENRFLPDLDAIPPEIVRQSKMLWINYPNNPTAAVAGKDFFQRVVDFAHRNRIIVCHDAAYTEIAFDGFRPMSLLQIEGAREVAIEFHSLSKTFNMTGWRIGMAVGNSDLVSGLAQVKSNVDSGVFQAVQEAGVEALRLADEVVEPSRRVYQERRDILVSGLHAAGFECERPRATFYVWVSVPKGLTSTQLTAKLLDEAGVVTTPGNGFGAAGEGYIRLTLCVNKDRLKEGVERIRQVKF
ncbi:MAG: LL-diaminopimelate aminotransferase [Deltaproteobacteria bacterium]|nr:LL-diaminopimelate aminotransferase [Deltaproteobacteria bacterium]MCZ6621278.1 LL-diaminopimelate aminotransferase [Deltaproteobacteria bacterium]